jgi:hypothetical protein
MTRRLLSATACLMVALAVTAAHADPTRTVASYPAGTFLENLAAAPGGTLLITSYFDRTLLAWDGAGAPVATFSTAAPTRRASSRSPRPSRTDRKG